MIRALLDLIRDIFARKEKRDIEAIEDLKSRMGLEIGLALGKMVYRIIAQVVFTDATTGWTRIHEKVKQAYLMRLGTAPMYWRYFNGKNGSCLV